MSLRFILMMIMCVIAPVTARALTKTITVPFNYGWPGSAWGCGDALPILYSGEFSGTFSGGMPIGSKVTNIKITMPMRRAGVFYAGGDADPVVTMSIAGQQIAAPNVVPGYFACPTRNDLISYTFDQPFAEGFEAYVPNSSNGFTISVQGGTCPHWCGVTARNDQVMTIEVTYDPPPPAEFAITSQATEEDRRILISNVRPEKPYPHFQAIGGKDGEVTTYLRARDSNGQFKEGLTVYMRVFDPPDNAPYMNQPGNVLAHNGDNTSTSATLDGPGITLYSPGIYQVTSGTNGRVDFTLHLPPDVAAGDNYQIEASLDPGFPVKGSVKSGILTAWKRVFIEKSNMLRNGLFLARDAKAGDTYIVTRRNHWFGNQTNQDELSKGEKIVIVHAPQLNRSDLNPAWYKEFHTILSVQELGNNEFRVNLGTKQGKNIIAEPLTNDYYVDVRNSAIGDAIAKLDTLELTEADVFDTPMDLVTGEAFRDSFTENIILSELSTPGADVPVPFLESSDEPLLQDLAEKWSSVVNPTLAPNHQLLIIASDNNPVVGGAPGDLSDASGLTISQVSGRTSSFVFWDGIDQQVKGNSTNQLIITWARKTAAHEIAHQWRTNGVWTPSDHCPKTTKAWNDPSVYCLLADYDMKLAGSIAQRTNGKTRFHLLPLAAGGWHSEYLGIRRRPDPFRP